MRLGAVARLRDERGQVVFVAAILMVGLLGGMALVTDVGGWFANDRVLKRGADASSTAGARKLAYTGDTSQASSAANDNVTANNGLPSPNENSYAQYTGYPQFPTGTTECPSTTPPTCIRTNVFKGAAQLPQIMVAPPPTSTGPTSCPHPAGGARSACSTAAVYPLTGAPGILPLLAYQPDAQPGTTMRINIHTTPQDNNAIPWTGSGYFGWANPCGQGVGNADKCIPDPTCVTLPTSSCDVTTIDSDFQRIIGVPNLERVLKKLCPGSGPNPQSGSCAPGTTYNGLSVVIPLYKNDPCHFGSLSCDTSDISYDVDTLAVVKINDGFWQEYTFRPPGPGPVRHGVDGWLNVTFERFVPPGGFGSPPAGGSNPCFTSGACVIVIVN
jgi:hypothetical protein